MRMDRMTARLQAALLCETGAHHTVAETTELLACREMQTAKGEVFELGANDRCALGLKADVQRDGARAVIAAQFGQRAKGKRDEVLALEVERGHHQIQRTAARAHDLRRGSGAGA